ncbi:MAG: hypothetical protein ACON42_06475 [Flavobacteriaceae bacterium]
MKKYLLGLFFLVTTVHAQQTASLNCAVDSLSVQIGAQINYSLQLKTQAGAEVLFPDNPKFGPFEILEIKPLETLQAPNHLLLTRKIALIQFDSGRYYIPPQKVQVNGQVLSSDSLLVEVADVVVDTLKQPLYDIKPIVAVEQNYEALIQQLVIGGLGLILLGILTYIFIRQWRKRRALQQGLPPFDRALNALKDLENESPQTQEEYKDYYSTMTEIVREYLEEEAQISAMESTTDELLLKLELLKEKGTLELDDQILRDLKSVLQKADLVKFARSVPEAGTLAEDLTKAELMVVKTQEALPEPTEEEMRQKAIYEKQLRSIRIKRLWTRGAIIGAFTLLTTLGLSIVYWGYYPVRDTLLLYPTKRLISNNWFASQYGTPPLLLETPEVLLRASNSPKGVERFTYGSVDEAFYFDLKFDFPQKKPADQQNVPQQADEAAAQALVDAIIQDFEAKGAVNILIKNDKMELPSGIEVAKIFGTLDYPQKGASKRVRCKYTTLLMVFNEGTITVTCMYAKEDRYGEAIETRIFNSINLIEQL